MTTRPSDTWALALVGLLLAVTPLVRAAGTDAMPDLAAESGALRLDRSRAALASGDPRRAALAAALHDGWRGGAGQRDPIDDPAAFARRAALEQLAVEAVVLAVAHGGQDPVVQLLLAQVCDQAWAGCDADAATARLAELEPGNGLAALLALSRAHARRSTAEQQAALATLAAASRFLTHDAALLATARDYVADAAIASATRRAAPEGLTDDDLRALLAFGLWLASPRVSSYPLVSVCRAAPGHTDEHRDCIAAARVVAGAEDAVNPRLALGLLDQLVVDPDERARVRARMRDRDWQRHAYEALAPRAFDTPGTAAAELAATIAAGGEASLRTQRLTAAGIPLAAPADWVATESRLQD